MPRRIAESETPGGASVERRLRYCVNASMSACDIWKRGMAACSGLPAGSMPIETARTSSRSVYSGCVLPLGWVTP